MVEQSYTEKEPDLFKDIIKSILEKREKCFSEKVYNAFVVNMALGKSIDTVIYANQMNMFYDLPKDMQYDYLFNSVRKYKRPFQPWDKNSKNAKLEIIQEFFGYSPQKAKEISPLISDEQITQIQQVLDKGGSKSKK